LSMSLVTRESTSPRCARSKYRNGSRRRRFVRLGESGQDAGACGGPG
jgi:hypothetical protein